MEVLYFSAIWCGPCQEFGPTLEHVASEEGVTVRKLDMDSDEGMDLGIEHGILSIPTLVAGKYKLQGAKDGETLRKWLRKRCENS